METNLTNRDNVALQFYAHAYTENNVPLSTLSSMSVNRKSSLVNANSVQKYRFEFDSVVQIDGSVVPISQDDSSTYYMYVFVTDSDGDHVLKSLSIDKE